MPTQKEIWEQEYTSPSMLVRIHSDKPSRPLPEFIDFVAERFKDPRFLDMGCGKGRNSNYIASKGFAVTGIDFAASAVNEARKMYKDLTFEAHDLTERWPFPDESYNAIIDCNVTLDIPDPGRTFVISEAHRVLVKGGFYLFYGVGHHSIDYNGPEPNSVLYLSNKKFEKHYTKDELLHAYRNFRLVSLREVIDSETIEGKPENYPVWISIFQK